MHERNVKLQRIPCLRVLARTLTLAGHKAKKKKKTTRKEFFVSEYEVKWMVCDYIRFIWDLAHG